MTELDDILRYIADRYPRNKQLSQLRLIKILYLADWRSALVQERQLTSIKWLFGECGLEPDRSIEMPNSKSLNFFTSHSALTSEEKEILDHAIQTSSTKGWLDLNSIVYSTYPILRQNNEGRELDLVQLSHLYKELVNEQVRKNKTLEDTDIGIPRC